MQQTVTKSLCYNLFYSSHSYILHICTVDKNILETAVALNFQDFEDAVQYACAMKSMVDMIVTRDVSGFLGSEIPVILPGELNHISRE